MAMTHKERAAAKVAAHELSIAVDDELARFNVCVQEMGAPVILHTAFGDYVVDYVDADWWYHTHPVGQVKDSFNARSFCGCNNGTWASLMEQAGCSRNPRFVR